MKQLNRALGWVTEAMAAEALAAKGYEILERNYANRYGEIDIIAKDHDTVVFVEVKAKTGLTFGHPEEMITKGKLAKIKRLASLYIGDHPVLCRIDVVAIVLNPQQEIMRLTHYENVS